MPKIIGWAIAALLLLPALRTDEASAAAEGKRIAVFVGPTQDKYLGAISKSISDHATAMGMKVNVFSSPFDPALQAQQIDDAIAQKFDLFVVQTISQKAIVPPLSRAKQANIPVILIVVPLASPETEGVFLSYVGYEDVSMGRMAGEQLVEALKGSGKPKGRVAIVAGSMEEGKAPLRERAFREAVSKNPGFEVVATEDSKWNPANGERIAGQLLARFAGQGGLDGMYGMNDTLANSVIQAADSAGVKLGPGGLIVVGGNCQAPGVRNLEAGKMAATLLMLPAEEGKLVAQKINEHFEGKKLDKAAYIEAEPITKANIAKYKDACSY